MRRGKNEGDVSDIVTSKPIQKKRMIAAAIKQVDSLFDQSCHHHDRSGIDTYSGHHVLGVGSQYRRSVGRQHSIIILLWF